MSMKEYRASSRSIREEAFLWGKGKRKGIVVH